MCNVSFDIELKRLRLNEFDLEEQLLKPLEFSKLSFESLKSQKS